MKCSFLVSKLQHPPARARVSSFELPMCLKPIQSLEDNKAILFCSLWVSASSCSCYNLSPNFETPCFDSVPCFWISLYVVEIHILIYSHTSRFCPSQILWFFFMIESLWQPCIKEAYQHRSSTSICSLHVSMSHFGNFYSISNVFIVFIMTCDQWSLVLLLWLAEGLGDG